jgi:predicted ATP-grasp superfamily ATP-dependent carboligase
MKPHILIVTKTYSTSLGIIRSLGIEGYHIELFYITRVRRMSEIPGSSKYVKETTEFFGRDDDAIIKEILLKYSQRKEQYFLFPTDDYAASLIDRHSNKLSKYFLMPYVVDGGQGSVSHLMDKAVQTELARKSGFPTAKEWVISLEKDNLLVPDDIVFPCFVKPLVSAQGYKKELGICNDHEELQNKLYTLQSAMKKRSVMIQEYLDITKEFSMSGVCIDQTIILPAIVEKLRIAQHEKGVTLFGELVPVDEISKVKDALFKFLESLHFVGMFDLEVMCVGEKIYFGEMNLRSGGPNYSYYGSGVNLPNILVKAIVEKTIDDIPEIEMHKKFLYEKAAWEDYQMGFMNKKELKSLYHEADILLLDCEEDPEPGKLFLQYIKTRVVKTHLKKKLLPLLNIIKH